MQWYCIHTRLKKEARVAEYCRAVLGTETYLPKLREQRVIRRVKRTVLNPLFPRYVFCRFEPSELYRAVRFAPDVLDIVHQGARPALVPPTLISDLRAWAGDAVDIITLHPTLKEGEEVEVRAGPFKGLRGTILRAPDERQRVAVLLSILQCGAQATVNQSDLRRVS